MCDRYNLHVLKVFVAVEIFCVHINIIFAANLKHKFTQSATCMQMFHMQTQSDIQQQAVKLLANIISQAQNILKTL